MTITAIKQQEQLKGRYSIYVDKKYVFSLSADTLLDQGLVPGQEIDGDQLKHYKRLAAEDKAYGLARAYVIRCMRSRHELNSYFRRKEYSDELSERITHKLVDLGLVDDEQFAEAWVRNRRLLKAVSKRRLVQELRQKGVASHTIEHVLAEDDTDEQSVLRELVLRKRKQSRYRDDTKLMQYLARQGFAYDDIKVAISD